MKKIEKFKLAKSDFLNDLKIPYLIPHKTMWRSQILFCNTPRSRLFLIETTPDLSTDPRSNYIQLLNQAAWIKVLTHLTSSKDESSGRPMLNSLAERFEFGYRSQTAFPSNTGSQKFRNKLDSKSRVLDSNH